MVWANPSRSVVSHECTLCIYSMHLICLLNTSYVFIQCNVFVVWYQEVLLEYSIPNIIISAEGASEKLET